MASIHLDQKIADHDRRVALFGGDIFLYTPTDATLALVEFARSMVEATFAPHKPRVIHRSLSKEDCIARLSELKPSFIHHRECKRLISGLLTKFGCDPTQVYFDVPRLRTSYPEDFLTTGIAYAFPHHRDTWYSAPQFQLNWWLPIYDLEDNGLSFSPRYFDRPVANNSRHYNYYQWNANSRGVAAQQVNRETRLLPEATEPIPGCDDLHVVCPAGSLVIFSAAQLHASVPNATGAARYSVDFRTVHLDDARAGRGAPNVDSRCTGHTMRDYLRAADYAHIPDDVVAMFDDGTEQEGLLVYEPQKVR